ncbi:MAG TPA: LuxR C-terminal-related transcriptional regulator [Acidimicrobiales bacterium]|nr:LuxR C-terminal-related transcriptional regulator [Acidimicrobiales bacterium]
MIASETLREAGVSEREAEVLRLVADRATNAEIAAQLYVSVRTVESHVSSLLRKLDAADRRALARLADDAAASGGDDASGAGAHDGAAALRPGPASGLPVPLTSFVGRAAEVSALTAALRGNRLVTAIGPGGVGKTRLVTAVAGEVAGDRRDGVWFVDLVPVTDPDHVAAAVGATLGMEEPRGRTIEDALLADLADAEALIVLDNCEHVVDGVAVFVERLLGRCPGVSVLATSQARLLLPFESTFPVPGLSLPDGGGDEVGGDGDGDGDAVALFVERARQVGVSDFTAADRRRIGEICRRLDGMALAIELAAARVPSLGLDGIEQGLSERFRLLAGGSRVDERHQSLRSTIDWSYNLLARGDKGLLRRVAVFAAPFTAATAAAVAGIPPVDPTEVAEGLARLAEHSLLVAKPGAETRYRMLETIRQYGEDETADHGELDGVRRRHLAWTRDVLADLDAQSDMSLAEGLGWSEGYAAWRAAFDQVAPDARAALMWAKRQDGIRAEAVEQIGFLASTCFTRGLLAEAQRRYEQVAERAGPGPARTEALLSAAGAATSRHTGNEALRLWRAASDAAVADGDPGAAAYALSRAAELVSRGPGIIASYPPEGEVDRLLAEAAPLASASGPPSSPERARAEVAILNARAFDINDRPPEEMAARTSAAIAAAESLGDPLLLSAALDAVTCVHLSFGELPAAVTAVARRIELVSAVRPVAQCGMEISDTYAMASEVALAAGDFGAARRYADILAGLPFHSEEGHIAVSRRLKVDALAGNIDRALADAARFRRGWEKAGRPVAKNLSGGAYAAAMIHGLRGDEPARAEWIGIATGLGGEPLRLEDCGTGYAPTFDAIVLLHMGDPAGAVARLAEDPADIQSWSNGEWRTWYAGLYAEAAVLTNHPDAEARIASARAVAAPNPIAAAIVDRATALAAADKARLVAVANTLAEAGCPYQWARTMILAGGDEATRGRQVLTDLGTAPMAEPKVF